MTLLNITKTAVTISLATILLCACGRFDSNITFKNTTKQNIYVERVYGFPYEPPVGYLVSNASATAYMGSMKFPEKIVIEWWYRPRDDQWEPDGDAFKTKISLKNIKPPQGKEEIIFTLIDQEKWIVEVRQP